MLLRSSTHVFYWSLVCLTSIQLSTAQRKPCNVSANDCGTQSRCLNSMCQCNNNYASASGSNCERVDSTCHSGSQDCSICDGDLCIRCVLGYAVVPPDGNCVPATSCSRRTIIISATQGIDGKFWGNVCQSQSQSSSGDGGLTTTVIVIIVVVAVLVLIIIGVIGLVVVRSVKARASWRINSPAPTDNSIMMRPRVRTAAERRESMRLSKEVEAHVNKGFEFDDSTMPSEQESDEFMKHLSELRQHAETFLTILNDMRKRLKTLQSDSESTKQCKKVIKDLSRLLFLLNKKPQSVQMPPDGLKLLTWAEHILNRYKEARLERIEDSDQSGSMTAADIEAQIDDD